MGESSLSAVLEVVRLSEVLVAPQGQHLLLLLKSEGDGYMLSACLLREYRSGSDLSAEE
jgi:hypothetical protein